MRQVTGNANEREQKALIEYAVENGINPEDIYAMSWDYDKATFTMTTDKDGEIEKIDLTREESMKVNARALRFDLQRRMEKDKNLTVKEFFENLNESI